VPEVFAQNTETMPFPGVRRLHRRTSDQNINVLFVDLCRAGVSLRATAESERGRRTSSYGALVGAQAAVNGDFFGSGYRTNGLAMHAGTSWSGSRDHNYVAPVAAGRGTVRISAHEAVETPTQWMREIVSGHPTLLADGVARDNTGDAGLCAQRHPRTAIGLSRDKRTLILAVVDGRRSSMIGMTCAELGALMAFAGAHDAVNMDGGGSSAMWLAGLGVVSSPSDSTGERTVANHLGVFARGSGVASHCPDRNFNASYEGVTGFPGGTRMTLTAGSTAHGCLRFRNTGGATWPAGTTRLGTTEPRDHASALAASDWLSPNRMASLGRDLAPMASAEFCFSVRAPTTPGVYREHFNLLVEGVTWFSDAGGPEDDAYTLQVTSEAPPRPDAGARDAGVRDAGASPDAGSGARDAGAERDAGSRDDGGHSDDAGLGAEDAGAGASDAGASPWDASVPDGAAGPSSDDGGEVRAPIEPPAGCGCGGYAGSIPAGVSLILLWVLVRRRR
jgi:uncharacterized protein (TIGR03382 family)